MSQPCLSKPNGWPLGSFRLLLSSQNRRVFRVKTPGKNTTNRMNRMSSAEITKSGFFRSYFQASL